MKLSFDTAVNLKTHLLITGPTGVGKSYLAKKIYNHSLINKSNFTTMHLASIKDELFESELFGHKKGSFTGAIESKAGYLEITQDGTLFLDEIGELTLEMQKKLLYLLEEKKFTPVGDTRSKQYRGRIIMATNKNLDHLVKTNQFREDLYYRIKTFNLVIPALNDQMDKFEIILKDVLNKIQNQYDLKELKISKDAVELLKKLKWRGNVRELKNSLEFICLIGDSPYINTKSINTYLNDNVEFCCSSESLIDPILQDCYQTHMKKFEKEFLKSKLQKFNGSVNTTAKKLGISKTTLIYKIKSYQIDALKMRESHRDRNLFQSSVA